MSSASLAETVASLIQAQGANAARAREATGAVWGGALRDIGQTVQQGIATATDPKRQEFARQQQGRKALAQAITSTPPGADGAPDHQAIVAKVSAAGFPDIGEAWLSTAAKNADNLSKLDTAHRAAQKAVQDAQRQTLATIGDAAYHADTPEKFTSSIGYLAAHGLLGQTPQDNEQQAHAILAQADAAGPDGWKTIRDQYLQHSPTWLKQQEERAKPVVLPPTPRGGAPAQQVVNGEVVATGGTAQPPAPTEAELALDAANAASPTHAQSAAAIAIVQGPQIAARDETARHNKEMERIGALTAGREAAQAAETARHNRAVEAANNPLAALSGGGAPGTPNALAGLTGQAFLEKLPAPVASEVRAYAEGRRPFPAGFALKSPYFQSLIQMVGQYDPGFDAVNYNARSKTRNDFTSGKSAQTINALNTVTQHLDRLSTSADALSNSWSPTYNSIANFLSKQSGNKAVTTFETDKKAVVDELTRAWRQAGGSEGDIKSWSQVLDASNSPEQLHGAIAEMGHLLEGKLSAMQEQFTQGMGTAADLRIVTPQARATLDRLEAKAGGKASGSVPKDGDVKPIDGHPGTEQTYRNGKWIRTK